MFHQIYDSLLDAVSRVTDLDSAGLEPTLAAELCTFLAVLAYRLVHRSSWLVLRTPPLWVVVVVVEGEDAGLALVVTRTQQLQELSPLRLP